jgi:hypothetical protein
VNKKKIICLELLARYKAEGDDFSSIIVTGSFRLPLEFFPCKFLVVHISPTRTEELNSHHLQIPMWMEGIDTMGCCLVPQRDCL